MSQRLRRMMGMGPKLRPFEYIGERGGPQFDTRPRGTSQGAITAPLSPQRIGETSWKHGGRSIDRGYRADWMQERDDVNYPKDRRMTLSNTPGYRGAEFTATVHRPNDMDPWDGNRSKSGKKFLVQGQMTQADSLPRSPDSPPKGSTRDVYVSTPKRAEWAAQAMANRAAKTGDLNVRQTGRGKRAKGVYAASQAQVGLRKEIRGDSGGW